MKTHFQIDPDDLAEIPDRATLRSGFTTGTAATAAAVAAARLLGGQPLPPLVKVVLPGGETLAVKVAHGALLNEGEAVATVIKDGGDDPDATNGAEIGALVRRKTQPDFLRVIGGRGVGRITRPGLALPPGQWAINPGPLSMLKENLQPFMGHFPGLEVEVFVERGEDLAAATLNPRLGILGGISILGTTGLVKPFSNEAYIATVDSALSLARAAGYTETVLTTGRQSEKLALENRPDLPLESFVQIADFFGDSLELASKYGFETIGLAVFFGKAVKQSAGHRNTHAHRHDQDAAALAQWLPGLADQTRRQIEKAMTARAALEILKEAGHSPLAALVAEKALKEARRFTGPGPKLWMTIFDYDGAILAQWQA